MRPLSLLLPCLLVLAQACTPHLPSAATLPQEAAERTGGIDTASATAVEIPRDVVLDEAGADVDAPIRAPTAATARPSATRDTLRVAVDTATGRPLDSFLIDALGQVYRWRPNGAITKYAVASEVLSGVAPELRYQNTRLGRLAHVDLTNPLRPVLFYRAAQTVVYLDRNMAELRQLNLVDLDLGQVDAIAYARNDALWVYTADRQQLLLIDRQNRVTQQSPVFSQLFGKPVRVAEMVATAQQVALATEDGRLLFFGPFGSFRTQVLRPGRYLVADEERLLFFEGGGWAAVARELGLVQEIDLGGGGRSLLMVRGERVLWYRGGVVWVD